MAKKTVRKTAARKRRAEGKVTLNSVVGVSVAAMYIRDDSTLAKPGTIYCYPDGVVIWIIGNEYAGDVTVQISSSKDGFQYCAKNKYKKTLLKFKAGDSTVVPEGGYGVIIAQVKHQLAGEMPECFKYDVVVKPSGKGTDTYDPDLEVTPPPETVPPRGIKNPLGIKGHLN